MNNNISIWKKIKLFNQFKRTIRSCENELISKYNVRTDWSTRLYTVINLPENLIGEAYSLKKSDIDKISENFLREYTFELSKFLDEKQLKELYRIYEIKKVDKYSYLIVIGFSLLQSNKYYNNLYYKILPISAITIITLLLLLL